MNADTLAALADLITALDRAATTAGFELIGAVDVRLNDNTSIGELTFNGATESTFAT